MKIILTFILLICIISSKSWNKHTYEDMPGLFIKRSVESDI